MDLISRLARKSEEADSISQHVPYVHDLPLQDNWLASLYKLGFRRTFAFPSRSTSLYRDYRFPLHLNVNGRLQGRRFSFLWYIFSTLYRHETFTTMLWGLVDSVFDKMLRLLPFCHAVPDCSSVETLRGRSWAPGRSVQKLQSAIHKKRSAH